MHIYIVCVVVILIFMLTLILIWILIYLYLIESLDHHVVMCHMPNFRGSSHPLPRPPRHICCKDSLESRRPTRSDGTL